MTARKKHDDHEARPEPEATGAAAEEKPEAMAEAPADPSPEEALAALAGERDELKDRLIRALAEIENTRKRGERERKDAETYGGARLARDLLSVYDNLGRALETVDDDLRARAPAFIEGVELTRRELVNAFAKHGITPVTPEPGDRFDPRLHQAMFEAPVPGSTPGTVIQVMQTGFVIGERLLRPAMVGVASAAPAAETAQEQAAK